MSNEHPDNSTPKPANNQIPKIPYHPDLDIDLVVTMYDEECLLCEEPIPEDTECFVLEQSAYMPRYVCIEGKTWKCHLTSPDELLTAYEQSQ